MGNSLQDQLLKAKVGNKQQAQKANSQRRKKLKNRTLSQENDATAAQVKQEQAEKVARDRALNRQKQEEAERKTVAAQIIQLIELNCLARDKGEQPYNFVDGANVRKIYVTDSMHKQLVSGQLSIVKLREQYEIVPKGVADKISERDATVVIVRDQQERASEEDEQYADHKVPDDLMW
ncbi:MAG: DUF2058 domain-containing protein [Gammaproteobacteria bacterium]|jgi:uncharacterized protein|nr:DUF2058 domain-containing protein [Gammaproteobacteria bacterium]MBT7307922.1 DUF2058 domain-containing protein [Gammaproteobacteria bacterium]